LGELRAGDVGETVEVDVLVSAVSDVRPRTTVAWFQCMRCGATHKVEQDGIKRLIMPMYCPDAHGGCGRTATKFRKLQRESEKTDERWLVVQELPEHVSGNDRPVSKHVRMLGRELVDIELHQGDSVLLKGVLKEYDEPDSRGGWKIAPETFIEAGEVMVRNKTDVEVYEEDIERIEELAKDPEVLGRILIPSIAPHIVGHDDLKAALAVQMFGGVDRMLGTKESRGAIHTLLLGDPSTAKTQLAKAVRRLMPRAVYTTMASTTKVGLTAASVQMKEFGEGRFIIRAGVLPMANGSIAIIDEIGEAKTADFKALEECMSEGWVTKAAGGEYMPMQARTSILAVGNPKDGKRWEMGTPMQLQIDIPPSTLSRFDMFFIVIDRTDTDAAMRESLYQHHGLGPMPERQPVRDDLFRKYVCWASKFNPKITEEAAEVLNKAHDDLRALENSPFTKRTIESMLRIAQALARMNLSSTIERRHAEKAVHIHQAGWKPIIDEHYGGGPVNMEVVKPRSQDERTRAVRNLLDKMFDPASGNGVPFTFLAKEAENIGIEEDELRRVLRRLLDDGLVYEPKHDLWRTA
jgi:replicative DNA helicase Mcm